MNVKVYYEKSAVPIDWNWPVQVGFLRSLAAEELLAEFNKYRWLERLAHGYQISRVRPTANILILDGELDKIEQALRENPFPIHVDLLVIFLEAGTNLPSNFREIVAQLPQVSYNSFFFGIKRPGESLLYWLEGVIYYLSHNESIDKAIDQVDWEGRLVTSIELVKEGKVSRVLDKVLDKIDQSRRFRNYQFNKVLTRKIRDRIDEHSYTTRGGIGGEDPAEVIAEIKKKKESFAYNAESGEATTVKDITVNHSANTSSMLEAIESEVGAQPALAEDRYLQCAFHDQQNEPAQHALLINKPYIFRVKIDQPDEDFLQGAKVTDDDIKIEAGKSEQVDLALRYDGTIKQEILQLPATGSSTLASFDINIPKEGEMQFELFAYHKGRLFQQINLSVFFCQQKKHIKTVPNIKIRPINMPRLSFSDFGQREEYGLSITDTDGAPILMQKATITPIRDEGQIVTFSKKVQKEIETYVKAKAPDAKKLIRSLAKHGSILYKGLFENSEVFDKPIQIISPSSNHFPLEFVYTYKLTGTTKQELCPNAATALEQGECTSCKKDEGRYICPFGFAALRTIIERHEVGVNTNLPNSNSIGLKTDVTMNRPALPVLGKILFATSEKLEDLQKRIAKKIKEKANSANEATNWSEWGKGLQQEPDSLIIIGHVAPSADDDGIEELEIGGDTLSKAFIDPELLRKDGTTIKPFVILIGCNIQDVEMPFVDFATLFRRSGAAIVLSTFTKIRAIQAVPLVEQLIDILKTDTSGQEIRFGEVMLKLRQRLFAQGQYVSMALVSHGDADWKLTAAKA